MREIFEKFPSQMNFKDYYSFKNRITYLTTIDSTKPRNRGC